MLHTVLFCLIILVTFVFQAVTGFGGPLIAMPLAIPLVGVATAKPILTLCSWVTSILVLLRSHRDVNLRETVKMASVIILFLFLGSWLFERLQLSFLLILYGIFVTSVGLKKLFLPAKHTPPRWLMLFSLCAAGVMHGLFLSGGSFLVIYAVNTLHGKQEFRATMGALWFTVNSVQLAGFLANGLFSRLGHLSLLSVCLTALATGIGSILSQRLSQERFLKVTYWMLVVSGLVLLYNSL